MSSPKINYPSHYQPYVYGWVHTANSLHLIYFQNTYNENGLLDFPYIFEGGGVENKFLLNHFGQYPCGRNKTIYALYGQNPMRS